MKTCLIDQDAGLGDIFVCQKIAEVYHKNGYSVTWPVREPIFWLKDYLLNSEYINYTREKPDPSKFDVYLKLDKSSPGPEIMKSKYRVANLDIDNWQDYFNYRRNTEKENYLYYNILNLKDGEEYTFISNLFGSPPETYYYPIEESKEEKNVKLRMIEGYTLFDWLKVIENASKIKIVETSINYILEKVDLKAKDLTCYCRWGQYTYDEVNFLYKKPWKYAW